MVNQLHTAAALLACASLVQAQYYGYGGYGGGSNGNNNPYTNGGQFANGVYAFGGQTEEHRRMVIAHAVLASLAFIILFPAGSIIVRLGTFRGVWIVHAVCQALGYLSFVAGAGIGIYIAQNIRVIGHYHPIIGLVLLAVLFIQPFLGLAHHFRFVKTHTRGVFSYLHIWIGRLAITLGIINVAFGLLLAQRLGWPRPGLAGWIVYIVLAVIMWLAYVISAIVGEVKRSRAQRRLAQTPKAVDAPVADNGIPDTKEANRYA